MARWQQKKGPGIPRTLVFDEIDTGIGGRAAEAVGKKLKELARTNQVLCVTHLPQIATFADHHYLIEKKEFGRPQPAPPSAISRGMNGPKRWPACSAGPRSRKAHSNMPSR